MHLVAQFAQARAVPECLDGRGQQVADDGFGLAVAEAEAAVDLDRNGLPRRITVAAGRAAFGEGVAAQQQVLEGTARQVQFFQRTHREHRQPAPRGLAQRRAQAGEGALCI